MEGREFAVHLPAVGLVALVVVFQTLDPLRVLDVFGDHVENLHLVVGRNLVARGALLDFESYVCVLVESVFGEPHRRELAPTQLLNDHISLNEHFAEMDGMVAADLILLDALVL